MTENHSHQADLLKKRFSGYLPVVIDIETGGLEPLKNPILEIAALLIEISQEKKLYLGELFASHVLPFKGATLDPVSLEITRIDPYHPFRFAIEEKKNVAGSICICGKSHNCPWLSPSGARRAQCPF